MMKSTLFFIAITMFSCVDKLTPNDQSGIEVNKGTTPKPVNEEQVKEEVMTVLDQWHKAAGNANFEEYFGIMSPNSIFIGTDVTENWDLEEFKEYSKPYFERGSAWSFTPMERHIYFSRNGETVWFDELLDTHMGICRGSGVLVLEDGQWKIKHYVLSMTVPNDKAAEVTALKRETDSLLLQQAKRIP